MTIEQVLLLKDHTIYELVILIEKMFSRDNKSKQKIAGHIEIHNGQAFKTLMTFFNNKENLTFSVQSLSQLPYIFRPLKNYIRNQ